MPAGIREEDDAASGRSEGQVRSGASRDGAPDDASLTQRFIIISIDMVNAYNEFKRAAVMDAHNRHIYPRRMVP